MKKIMICLLSLFVLNSQVAMATSKLPEDILSVKPTVETRKLAELEKDKLAAKAKITRVNDQFTLISSQLSATNFVNSIIYQGKNGVIVIDSTIKHGKFIVDYVQNRMNKDAQVLINTHHHPDHVKGNSAFSNVKIIASSQGTYDRMTKNNEKVVANTIFKDIDKVTFNEKGDTLELHTYLNAHSGADTTIYFATENVIVIGDMINLGRFPYIDTASGGDLLTYIDSSKSIIDKIDDKTIVLSGHNLPTSKKEYIAYIELIEDMIVKVKKLKDQKQSLETVLAAKPLAEYKEMAWHLADETKFTTLIYQALTAK